MDFFVVWRVLNGVFILLFINVGVNAQRNCRCGLPGSAKTATPQGDDPVPDTSDERIVGGSSAPRGYWRWIAAIMDHGTFVCGASLVTDRHIITSAHCVTPGGNVSAASEFEVFLNLLDITNLTDPDVVRRKVSVITRHPLFNPWSWDYDIAILGLDSGVDIWSTGSPLFPVCLPAPVDHGMYVGAAATTVGWGSTSIGGVVPTPILQEVGVSILPDSECIKAYPEWPLTDTMICSGNAKGEHGVCAGDDGGPLMIRERSTGKFVLFGVNSWMVPNCALPKQPYTAARVSAMNTWIRTTTNYERLCPS